MTRLELLAAIEALRDEAMDSEDVTCMGAAELLDIVAGAVEIERTGALMTLIGAATKLAIITIVADRLDGHAAN